MWQLRSQKTPSRWKMRADLPWERFSSVFLLSGWGVCCPVNFPKASSLCLPKMLLNGSPFHSPVQLLMAFSSPKGAQLNQQEPFGRRKRAGKMLFPSPHTVAAAGASCASVRRGTQRHSRSLRLTFNTTASNRVATADYSDAAGDGGGRGLGSRRWSNKADVLAR